MSKMIDSEKLAALAKALDGRSKNFVEKEKARALEVEADLNSAIELLDLNINNKIDNICHDARAINNLELIWDGQINDREVTEEYTINNIQYTFVKIADFEIADATMCKADIKIDLNIFGSHTDSIANQSGAFVNNACVIKSDKYNLVIVTQDNTDVTMDSVAVNFSKGIWFTKCYDSSHPYAKESFTRVANLEIMSGYVKLVDTIFTSNKPGLVVYDENGIVLGEIFNSETNEATGECSHAEGYLCKAIGQYSHAEGSASRAEGGSSHAEGRSTTAESATYGHAEGYGSKAIGEMSHAEGYTTEAHGKYSHSEGHNSISSGTASHAEGYDCNAVGNYSHAEGYCTIANGVRQHVQGIFNVEDTESKYAHIVGNGTSDSARSNAHTLDWDGNAWFAGNVSINGTPVNDNDLVNKQYVDALLVNTPLNAITLNGYSLWVGSSTELNALPERDENTLYFEIDDDEIEEVVQVNIVDNKLNLTADKYQKANMINGTELIFPDVNKFTEIHLYFDANENMSLIFPDNCKYRVDPNIEEGNSYEIVATYNTMKWLVNIIVYS